MDTIKLNFQKISEQAHHDGAKVEMLLTGGENLSIGFQKRKLHSFESTQAQMAGLRVILGANQGYAYTENLSSESLLRTYNEALMNAKTVHNDEDFQIPLQGPSGATQLNQEMSHLFSSEEIPMDKKMEIARNLEAKCLDLDQRVQSVPYSGLAETVSSKRILNSEGLDQQFKQSYFSGYAYALAKEGESSKMDGEGFFVRTFKEINVDKVAQEGVQKAISRLGAQTLATGNYPVVICREQFPTVLNMISSYFSAKELHEGKSLFEGKLGQSIASEKFQLSDDPFRSDGRIVRPFDDEGAPSQKTVLVENGVLKSFLTNLEYSKKMQMAHTAHASRSPASSLGIAPTNLILAQGEKTLAELLASYPKVVYLTEFSGGLHAGFKESTGDFSLPAEGFLYENGKCLGAIDRFVISGNVLTLLSDIEQLGNEYNQPGSSMICPDVLVKSCSFAGA